MKGTKCNTMLKVVILNIRNQDTKEVNWNKSRNKTNRQERKPVRKLQQCLQLRKQNSKTKQSKKQDSK